MPNAILKELGVVIADAGSVLGVRSTGTSREVLPVITIPNLASTVGARQAQFLAVPGLSLERVSWALCTVVVGLGDPASIQISPMLVDRNFLRFQLIH
jgi:hypothetical protein